MDKLDLVPVFAAGDPIAVAVAKAILESAGIPFISKGEGVQDLLGVGRFPGGFNIATGPVQFLVRPEDAEQAQALLNDAGRRSTLGPLDNPPGEV